MDEDEQEKQVYTTIHSDSAQVQEILTRGMERVRSEMELEGAGKETEGEENEEEKGIKDEVRFLLLDCPLGLFRVILTVTLFSSHGASKKVHMLL